MNDIRRPRPDRPATKPPENTKNHPAEEKGAAKRQPAPAYPAATTALLLIAGTGLVSGLVLLNPAGLAAWLWLPIITLPLGYSLSRFTRPSTPVRRGVLMLLVAANAVLLFRTEPLIAVLLSPIPPLIAFRPQARGSWAPLALAGIAAVFILNAAALMPVSVAGIQPVSTTASISTGLTLAILLLVPAAQPKAGLRAVALWHLLVASGVAAVILALPATSLLEPMAAQAAPFVELAIGFCATGAALLLLRKTW